MKQSNGLCVPLRERIISVGASVEEKTIHVLPSRPLQYKAWNDENMLGAIKACTYDNVSVRKAAEMYGVPKSTLGDRMSGRVLDSVPSSRYLTNEEEQEVVSFVVGSASIGYPKTVKEIIALVQRILSARGVDRSVTYGWWESFRKRHPSLSLRTPAALSRPRAMASNCVVLDHYFDMLEETLFVNNLTDHPGLVFNMDETGMPLNPKPPKTVHAKGDKNPFSVCGDTKAQITVVGCVSAAGQCLPPMVIWDRKKLNREFTKKEIPGTIYGLCSKGWMNQELFNKWFTRHFLRYAPPARPLLLLLDGHSSHYSPETIKMAAEEKVVLFVLPPNTTHLCQPLDQGVFGPLKVAWRMACHDFLAKNPGQVVHRYVFSELLKTAWLDAMTMKNIISAFRTTGVFPVNRDAVVTKLPEQKLSLSEKTGVPFIPLYTPSKRKMHVSEERQTLDQTESSNELSYRISDEENDCQMLAPTRIDLQTILKVPSPLSKLPALDRGKCAQVVTSLEALEMLEAKDQAKAAKEQAKLQAKKAREENKKAKEETKKARKQAKKAKEEARVKVKEQTKKPKEQVKKLHLIKNGKILIIVESVTISCTFV